MSCGRSKSLRFGPPPTSLKSIMKPPRSPSPEPGSPQSPRKEPATLLDLDEPSTSKLVDWRHVVWEGESIGSVGVDRIIHGFRAQPSSFMPIRSLHYHLLNSATGEVLAKKRYGDWSFKVAAAGTSVWVCHWNVFCGVMRLGPNLEIQEHYPMIRDAVSANPELIPLSDFAAALAVYRKEHVKRLHIYFAKREFKVRIQPTLYIVAGRESSQGTCHGFLFLAYDSYNRNLQTFAVLDGRLTPPINTFALPIPSLRKMCAQFLGPSQGGGLMMVYQSDDLYEEETVHLQHYDKSLRPIGPKLKAKIQEARTLSDMCVQGKTIYLVTTPKTYAKKSCIIM